MERVEKIWLRKLCFLKSQLGAHVSFLSHIYMFKKKKMVCGEMKSLLYPITHTNQTNKNTRMR